MRETRSNVSVVVALFNGERTISEAIRSIADTNWPSVEVIVFDDGSNDGGLARAREAAKQCPSVKFTFANHLNNANLGAAATRNAAARLASGVYLAFLDADDLYFPHRFEESIKILDQNPEIDAVYGTFKYLLEASDGTTRVRDIGPEHVLESMSHDSPESPLEALLAGTLGLHTSTVTVRSSAFWRVGGFPHLKFAEDQALWMRLFATSVVRSVPGKALSLYRIHEGSLCSREFERPDFAFAPVKSRLDTIRWLRHLSTKSASLAARRITATVPGRLFHQYSRVPASARDTASDTAVNRLLLESSVAAPRLLVDRRFWSVLTRVWLRLVMRGQRPWKLA